MSITQNGLKQNLYVYFFLCKSILKGSAQTNATSFIVMASYVKLGHFSFVRKMLRDL